MAPPEKRKDPPTSNKSAKPHHAAKRVKMKDARTILSQASDKALNQSGELDVSAFVKAREFEIRAMEDSMLASKQFLSKRAFQQLPNSLRRRTASHNVKRVPKKARARATREMKDDNTPTVISRRRKPTSHLRLRLETAKRLQKLGARARQKRAEANAHGSAGADPEETVALASRLPRLKKNSLSHPEKPPSKFRKRQIGKAWLPTHIYHAKRAHMTEPKHPLWRFAIPLAPTEKSFRKTHRAGSVRGCVAWDTSYMSTVGVEGVEASLLGLLRSLGVGESALTGKNEEKWRRGTRSWKGWVKERDKDNIWIAEVCVIWHAENKTSEVEDVKTSKEKKPRRRLLIRVHPSAFLQLWTEILKVAKMQRPPAMIEDLRFEIGSIEVIGPGSTEALVSTLQPIHSASDEPVTDFPPEKIWCSLGSITNPSSLPQNAMLGFKISDPRLRYPPQKITQTMSEADADARLQLLSAWPPDTTQTPQSVFDRTARLTASRLLPSQKSINRRKGAGPPGSYPDPLPTDPHIPVLLTVSRPTSSNAQGSWTLLLPWKCVLPVWYYLMHYPLSTGGNPRFGGLNEMRQLRFEQGIPWFPGDFPGTKAGKEWEIRERVSWKADWEKKPKGKRVEWTSLDLGEGRKGEAGEGWACDWEFLFDMFNSAVEPGNQSSTAESAVEAGPRTAKAADPQVTNSLQFQEFTHFPYPFSSKPALPPRALATIHLHLLTRGHPTARARIYRLPTTSPALRERWIALATSSLSANASNLSSSNYKRRIQPSNFSDSKKLLAMVPRNQHSHLRTQATAISILSAPACPFDAEFPEGGVPKPGDVSYPCVPDKEDLIGFVTTGNFDLGHGRCSAVGSVALAKVLRRQEEGGKEGESSVAFEDAGDTGKGGGKGNGKKGELTEGLLRRLCVVREAGQGLGRLARWEFA
ncbi:MAG: hypothetical protein Q9167_004638 [Letrouitia subvulpina]